MTIIKMTLREISLVNWKNIAEVSGMCIVIWPHGKHCLGDDIGEKKALQRPYMNLGKI